MRYLVLLASLVVFFPPLGAGQSSSVAHLNSELRLTTATDKTPSDNPSDNPPDKIVKQTFTTRGKKRTFYLFVPKSITAAKPAPLVVMLHGSGRNGMSLVEKWKDLAGKEGFIIAGPDSNSSDRWSSVDDPPDLLRDLVEHLKSQYPINTRRIYLFGHSAGAVYSLTLSMVESEYFAATAIHAGAWRHQDEYSVIPSAQRKIPIAIWVGTNDPYFSIPEVRSTRAALQAKGFPIEVTEMAGHDHYYYDLAPKINESAWEFLKQHELSGEQKYAEVGNERDNASANDLILEMNKLRQIAFEVSQQAETVDKELVRKSPGTDDAKRLAQQELDLLTKSAETWSLAAAKADSAARLRLNDRNARYLSLIAQHNRKNAQIVDGLRPQAEIFLNTGEIEPIRVKRNEVISNVSKLQLEALELQKQIDALMK
ncbi:MAG TPA: alpha/beta hydrolase-fold protein [Pyrinomonadaceae bacterium]|nr:alpha/beta hydrolase-fold protein [Pyrinomonadaceae bacterium]